jgi:NitT/TauT family transport system permease protein
MWRRVVPPVAVFVLGLGAAEVLVRVMNVPRYLVPAPTAVLATLFDPRDGPDLWGALLQTTGGSLLGFGLSVLAGLLVAVVLSSAGWVQRAFYPYAVFFQTVPIIAIAPLLVIWFGFGLPTVVAAAFIVSVFPMIANTLSGLLSTDPALRDLFRLYGAGPVATLLKLRLPSALPNILTGLRVAGGLAVIGAIVGEFITGAGLGGVIDVARTQQRTDKVFAGLLLASVLGLALFGLVNGLGRLLLGHWHASEQQKV